MTFNNQAHSEPPRSKLINRKQLREIIPASDMTVWRWTKAGLFPVPLKINGRNYWRLEDVENFVSGEFEANPIAATVGEPEENKERADECEAGL